ncbi:MAG TPA: nucleotidyltransferase family protein [Pseudomonadales bacterium]|nr:nucleotidyltransferase family protein [Pseudomonadales bacterium]
MILAAGRGERMRPLTDSIPKPLLEVAGLPLIGHTLKRLALAGCQRVVINCAHLGEQLPATLGTGHHYGLQIQYSHESIALETAGGIIQAMPLINAEQFVLINGDIWCEHPIAPLFDLDLQRDLAHLVMVPNPPQHPYGDFCLTRGRLSTKPHAETPGVTYSGLGLYSEKMFRGIAEGFRPLRPLLDNAMSQQRLSGELFTGEWRDIGTPQRLAELNAALMG